MDKRMDPLAPIDDVVHRLRARFGAAPSSAVVLGSGLSGLLGVLTQPEVVPYPELGLPESGAPGHAGRLAVGALGSTRVALLAGRWHSYEGYAADTVVLGVRALARWGVRRLILTNAAGGITPGLRVGDLVLISDHINLLGRNPLVGPNLDALGTRFPDMSAAYDPELRREAREMAAGLDIRLHEGVYAAMLGPSYETPAEIRFLRTVGADVVGMSTVLEVIAAVHAGVRVLGFSVVSNLAAGLGDEALSHHDVTLAADEAGPRLARLIEGLVATW